MKLTEIEFSSLREGDPKVFEKLYLHYEKPVYHFLLSKTGGDEEAAGDVFCETFLSAFTSLPRLKHADNIQAWLLQIASRRLADHLRKIYREKKKYRALQPADTAAGDVTDDLLNEEKKAMFILALDRIKPEFRRVLTLKYDERRSVNEIAALLEVTKTTVEGLLYRARQALKQELANLDYL